MSEFGNFSQKAKKTIKIARKEAEVLEQNFIGTEHLLLGLLKDSSNLVVSILNGIGITYENVKAEVKRNAKNSSMLSNISHKGNKKEAFPLTKRLQKVIENSVKESLKMESPKIGEEHLLLGLLSVEGGLAVQIMNVLGVTPEMAKKEVFRYLGQEPHHF